MTERYEFVRSDDCLSVLLVFSAGCWEFLPPEVRFSRAWYDGNGAAPLDLSAAQRTQIARQGYLILERRQETVGRFH